MRLYRFFVGLFVPQILVALMWGLGHAMSDAAAFAVMISGFGVFFLVILFGPALVFVFRGLSKPHPLAFSAGAALGVAIQAAIPVSFSLLEGRGINPRQNFAGIEILNARPSALYISPDGNFDSGFLPLFKAFNVPIFNVKAARIEEPFGQYDTQEVYVRRAMKDCLHGPAQIWQHQLSLDFIVSNGTAECIDYQYVNPPKFGDGVYFSFGLGVDRYNQRQSSHTTADAFLVQGAKKISLAHWEAGIVEDRAWGPWAIFFGPSRSSIGDSFTELEFMSAVLKTDLTVGDQKLSQQRSQELIQLALALFDHQEASAVTAGSHLFQWAFSGLPEDEKSSALSHLFSLLNRRPNNLELLSSLRALPRESFSLVVPLLLSHLTRSSNDPGPELMPIVFLLQEAGRIQPIAYGEFGNKALAEFKRYADSVVALEDDKIGQDFKNAEQEREKLFALFTFAEASSATLDGASPTEVLWSLNGRSLAVALDGLSSFSRKKHRDFAPERFLQKLPSIPNRHLQRFMNALRPYYYDRTSFYQLYRDVVTKRIQSEPQSAALLRNFLSGIPER